jgi:hypothetical protein
VGSFLFPFAKTPRQNSNFCALGAPADNPHCKAILGACILRSIKHTNAASRFHPIQLPNKSRPGTAKQCSGIISSGSFNGGDIPKRGDISLAKSVKIPNLKFIYRLASGIVGLS